MDFDRRHFLRWGAAPALTALVPSLALTYSGTTLENQLRAKITQMRRSGSLAADERVALVITDMLTQQKLVSINENLPLQCASMVKPFVIQTYLYCHYIKSSKLYPLNDKILEEMRGMIVHSNNTFTNYIFKRLGGPQGVQWMLKKEAPSIFRDIHIVENIPNGGKTYRNKASAGDYTRFLYAIWQNRLPGDHILKDLMGIPNHDRLIAWTKGAIPENTKIYDKTGSTARLCGDFGIINFRTRNGNLRPYTIACIIEKQRKASNYTHWITERSNAMRALSIETYRYFYARYPS